MLTCEDVPEVSIRWNLLENVPHQEQELKELDGATSVRVNLCQILYSGNHPSFHSYVFYHVLDLLTSRVVAHRLQHCA